MWRSTAFTRDQDRLTRVSSKGVHSLEEANALIQNSIEASQSDDPAHAELHGLYYISLVHVDGCNGVLPLFHWTKDGQGDWARVDHCQAFLGKG